MVRNAKAWGGWVLMAALAACSDPLPVPAPEGPGGGEGDDSCAGEPLVAVLPSTGERPDGVGFTARNCHAGRVEHYYGDDDHYVVFSIQDTRRPVPDELAALGKGPQEAWQTSMTLARELTGGSVAALRESAERSLQEPAILDVIGGERFLPLVIEVGADALVGGGWSQEETVTSAELLGLVHDRYVVLVRRSNDRDEIHDRHEAGQVFQPMVDMMHWSALER
ncbi:hypothetical protein [Isoalcanivorax beigongshangi]|uniref:Uncharacterized protein n=1 Tax=Isoalcanivorax beigongshangi TaxID=3238810 RepID=A0ABV4AH75_9GAMM